MAELSLFTVRTSSGRVYGWLARPAVTNVTALICRVLDSHPSQGGALGGLLTPKEA